MLIMAALEGKNASTQRADDKEEANSNTKEADDNSTTSFSVDDADVTDGDETRYGWFSIRPKFLQWLNSPKGYLFCLCFYLFGQGMAVNGLVYLVITTLERRFKLTSVESAFISSTYDFFFMFIVIFVTYFGERAHKPRILGIGALIFSCGSIVFTLPHFLSDPYNFEGAEFDTCESNRTDPNVCSEDGEEENLRKYYPVFIIAQGLHALGASSIFTLGLTYIDENSPPGTAAIHTGIFYITTTLGPAVGFLLGSEFLNIYTDILTDEDVAITPNSPLWVGAWWLGFLVTAGVCLLVSVPLLGFNRHLPSYKSAQKQRVNETQSGAEFKSNTTTSGVNKVADFPRAVWTLLKNPTYFFIDLACITEAFLLSFVSLFGPKIIESIFNLSTGDAALYTGFVVMPSGIIGSLVGGYVVMKYNLTVAQILKFIILVLCLSGACVFGFLLSCSNVPFAGVTVQYQNTTQGHDGTFNLTAPCNANCKCEDSFDAVCGSDGVMYYSSCHAGCTVELDDINGLKVLLDYTVGYTNDNYVKNDIP
ncbi:solute carrier organic anion transporter family member 4A1-like [Amphiura filiformis]|uniref:solute carrier organic anion transporter family member 4A1-like n=1 Tax=Amphiura filiformis TaxID=82378 RepID=UPI003B221AE4